MKPDQIAQMIAGSFAGIALVAGLSLGVAWLAALGVVFMAAVVIDLTVDLIVDAKRRRR